MCCAGQGRRGCFAVQTGCACKASRVQCQNMSILAGLSALTAAANLTKTMRDAAKSGTLKPEEFTGRVGEIYDYIIDSKAALVDAQEAMLQLQAKIRAFDDDKEFKSGLEFDPKGYYRRKGAGGDEFYCSACLDLNNKRSRLTGTRRALSCDVHGYRQDE